MNKQSYETSSPMPAKPRVKLRAVGDELILTWREPLWGVSLFLMLWLSGWSVGCGFLLHELLTDFKWFMLLFATPFFAAWVATVCTLIYMIFGVDRLILDRDSVRFSKSALIQLQTRDVDMEEVIFAKVDSEVTHKQNDVPVEQTFIHIRTLGEPIKFAHGLRDDEAEWLSETINVCLDRIAPNRMALTSAEYEEYEKDNSPEDEPVEDDGIEIFEPGREPVQQPSDSKWRQLREGRAIRFVAPSGWAFVELAFATFLNLFWNGIVGVFVWQLFVDFEWFLALFLIPFVVIGLGMFAYWFVSLTAPSWGAYYTFRPGRIETRWWGLYVFSWKWQIDFESIERVEIRQDEEDDERSQRLRFTPQARYDGDYLLVFIDGEQSELLEIGNLTLGEARWIADTLMSEFPIMFNRR